MCRKKATLRVVVIWGHPVAKSEILHINYIDSSGEDAFELRLILIRGKERSASIATAALQASDSTREFTFQVTVVNRSTNVDFESMSVEVEEVELKRSSSEYSGRSSNRIASDERN